MPFLSPNQQRASKHWRHNHTYATVKINWSRFQKTLECCQTALRQAISWQSQRGFNLANATIQMLKKVKVTSQTMLTFLKPISFLITVWFLFLPTTLNNFASFSCWRDIVAKRHHVGQPLFVLLIHSVCNSVRPSYYSNVPADALPSWTAQ